MVTFSKKSNQKESRDARTTTNWKGATRESYYCCAADLKRIEESRSLKGKLKKS